MTEAGPIAAERAAGCHGLHAIDALIVECVDPESGEATAGDGFGEVAVTMLGLEPSPLVRYRTGDLAGVVHGTCPRCGRRGATLVGWIRRVGAVNGGRAAACELLGEVRADRRKGRESTTS